MVDRDKAARMRHFSMQQGVDVATHPGEVPPYSSRMEDIQ
jgi:hypothetical protein